MIKVSILFNILSITNDKLQTLNIHEGCNKQNSYENARSCFKIFFGIFIFDQLFFQGFYIFL